MHTLLVLTELFNSRNLLYKHQWNTRWAFVQKLDFFTCENITIAVATQKSHLSHQKLFCYNYYHWCLYTCNKQNITWSLGDTKFLFSCWEKCFTHSLRSLVKYLSTLEKFCISTWLCYILYIIIVLASCLFMALT